MPDTDRELLEKAALAAGYQVNLLADNPEHWYRWDTPAKMVWNPLADDGDALRLAVKLRMDIAQFTEGVRVNAADGDDCYESHGSDPHAATRRAIVRAAAVLAQKSDARDPGSAS